MIAEFPALPIQSHEKVPGCSHKPW
jgi:hypothetical protein